MHLIVGTVDNINLIIFFTLHYYIIAWNSYKMSKLFDVNKSLYYNHNIAIPQIPKILGILMTRIKPDSK